MLKKTDKILVTGGTGLIGVNLVKRLEKEGFEEIKLFVKIYSSLLTHQLYIILQQGLVAYMQIQISNQASILIMFS